MRKAPILPLAGLLTLRSTGLLPRCALQQPVTLDVGLLMSTSLRDSDFDEMVSLRDAYRIMEAFVEAYRSRGDGLVSEFLYGFAGSSTVGLTMDPAAPNDFLAAVQAVISRSEKK